MKWSSEVEKMKEINKATKEILSRAIWDKETLYLINFYIYLATA